ncbi:MAG: hypothetical protein OHK0050_23830 [Roseiflexaceae bacterium]
MKTTRRMFLSSLIGGAIALGLATGSASAAPAIITSNTAILAEHGPHGGLPGTAGALVKATADATGLTNIQVLAELQNGKSLTQIAESRSKTASAIISAARTSIKTRLDKAVTDGKMTQAQADAALAKFDSEAPTIMADTTLGTQIGQQGREKATKVVAVGALIKETAEVTGLTNIQVMAELQNGKSLAQIAESKSKTASEIIANVRADLKTRLDKAVADGKRTQAEADAALAKYDSEAPTVMADTTLGTKVGQERGRPRR